MEFFPTFLGGCFEAPWTAATMPYSPEHIIPDGFRQWCGSFGRPGSPTVLSITGDLRCNVGNHLETGVREPLRSERNKHRLQLCGKAKYWWTFPSQNVAIKIHHSCVKRWKQQQIPGSFPDLCDRRANFRIYKTSGTMEMGRFTSPMHMNKSCAMYPRKQQPKERALVASFRLFLYNWITSLSHI